MANQNGCCRQLLYRYVPRDLVNTNAVLEFQLRHGYGDRCVSGKSLSEQR